MDIRKANEILNIKQKEKSETAEAERIIGEELERQRLAEIEAEKERKRQEMKEFVARIPRSICRPYARCTGCKTENELNNRALIETVDGTFRTVTCKQCGNFIVDYIDFKASEEDMVALEPYVYKMRSGEKW
jgi:hypothetical protein